MKYFLYVQAFCNNLNADLANLNTKEKADFIIGRLTGEGTKSLFKQIFNYMNFLKV